MCPVLRANESLPPLRDITDVVIHVSSAAATNAPPTIAAQKVTVFALSMGARV